MTKAIEEIVVDSCDSDSCYGDVVTLSIAHYPPALQPQAFPMQGSKRGQVPLIIQLIPEYAYRLIEPFCGSAAVSIGAKQAGKVENIILGDCNFDLINLWRNILFNPIELVDQYQIIWDEQFIAFNTKEYFTNIRAKYNDSHNKNAAEFLFILNRIVKSALRYSREGRINQSPDNRRCGAKPATVRNRIASTHAILQGVTTVTCQDWIATLDCANIDDVIYLDPPYQGTSNTKDHRYISGLSIDDFEEGLQSIKDFSFIISYDAIRGSNKYGRALHKDLSLLALDVITGVSAQGTLLGRKQQAHETIYLSPALVDRLGGVKSVIRKTRTPFIQESLPIYEYI